MTDRKRYRYDQLPPAGKRLARIPRFGHLIAAMPMSLLPKIETDAAAYWYLYSFIDPNLDTETGLIDSGLNTSEASLLGWQDSDPPLDRTSPFLGPETRRWQCRLAMGMLGAIAFEMFCRKTAAGGPSFEIDSDLAGFQRAVCKRFVASGAYVNELGTCLPELHFLRKDWPRLQHMNSHGMEHAILTSFGGKTIGSGPIKQRLFFADISAQAFFAAYWALRWTNDDKDVRKMGDWIPDPISEENSGYREFWQMVLEMPREAIEETESDACTDDRFQRVCAPFFDRKLQSDPQSPIRSTDLMYEMRERMEGSSAMAAFRYEFAELREQDASVAQSIFVDSSANSSTSQFIQLADPANPVDDKDTGTFLMGDVDDEPTKIAVRPFRLNRFCVTNAQYELFDPRHWSHREFEDSVDGDVGDHPVVNVGWLDALWFAQWLGETEIDGEPYRICLPTEQQWEYACRCGEQTAFTWIGRENGESISSGDCNFDSRHPWPEEFAAKNRGTYLKRTISTTGIDSTLAVHANPWGLNQMHGNVWEWCDSWYNDAVRRRVLRGGSWYNNGWLCRSGWRRGGAPSNYNWYYGFRLAAILK